MEQFMSIIKLLTNLILQLEICQKKLNKFIISINEAKKNDGGEGALIIKLKNLMTCFQME